MNISNETVKCGCIYSTKEGTLLLTCEFCDDYYYTLEALNLHVKYHLQETPHTIKPENSISYSIEYMPPVIQEVWKDSFKPQSEEVSQMTAAESQYLLLGIKREDSISFGSDNESSWKDSNLSLKGNTVSELSAAEVFVPNEKPAPTSANTINNNGKRSKRWNCNIVNKAKTESNTAKVIGKTDPSLPEIQVDRTHATIRKYAHKCSFCDLCFAGKNKLVDHENTHTGRQPYQCKFCPKTFAAASSLWSHNKLHTQERRHSCSVCDKTFAHKHMRDRHNREQHLPDTDPQRYFGCTKCDRKFKTHRQMCYHRAIHKNQTATFTCDYCQRQCKSRSILVDHMQKVHEGRTEIKKQRTFKRKTQSLTNEYTKKQTLQKEEES